MYYQREEPHKQARALLSQHPAAYVDFLTLLQRGSVDVVDACESGVLLRDCISGGYFLTAHDERTAEQLLSGIRDCIFLSCHEDFYLSRASRACSLPLMMVCYTAVYERSTPLPALHFDKIHTLTGAHVDFVMAHYDLAPDRSYIEQRIAAGELFGFWAEEGEPAGFIGLHDECSMGMLVVLPRFRRQKIGASLLSFLTNRQLALGATPYSQIKTDNIASLKLNEQLGFTIVDEPVYHLMRD